jgi:hypothetical protein
LKLCGKSAGVKRQARLLRKRWRRADGPRRAECAGEFACAAPFRIFFSYSELIIYLSFLATIFSEPEGFFSVYIPVLSNLRFERTAISLWSAPARNSGNIQPGAARPPAAIACLFRQKKFNRIRKALQEISNTVSGTFFYKKC